MKTRSSLMLAVALLTAGGTLAGFTAFDRTGWIAEDATATSIAVAAAETPYTLDPVHSHIVFATKHLGASHSYGMFHAPTGTLRFDPETSRLSDVRVSIDATKIDTGNNDRDDHLRGGDFFSAQEFPTITFRQTAPVSLSEGTSTLKGELTMLGKTMAVEAKVEMIGTGTNPFARKAVAGFEATFTIRRSEFDMNYGIDRGVLGDEVRLIVAIEAIAD
jgi:polyisoprenoid-binding protein YceI